MKRLLALTAASLFALALAPTAMALTPQQEKMKTCNADAKAKALKGDERKAFMKDCLSAKKSAEPAAKADDKTAKAEPKSAKATQQDKMKSCNADAKTKGLKGDDRKKFMSDCLKG